MRMNFLNEFGWNDLNECEKRCTRRGNMEQEYQNSIVNRISHPVIWLIDPIKIIVFECKGRVCKKFLEMKDWKQESIRSTHLKSFWKTSSFAFGIKLMWFLWVLIVFFDSGWMIIFGLGIVIWTSGFRSLNQSCSSVFTDLGIKSLESEAQSSILWNPISWIPSFRIRDFIFLHRNKHHCGSFSTENGISIDFNVTQTWKQATSIWRIVIESWSSSIFAHWVKHPIGMRVTSRRMMKSESDMHSWKQNFPICWIPLEMFTNFKEGHL